MIKPLKNIDTKCTGNVATYSGVSFKTLILLLLTIFSTLVTYSLITPTLVLPLIIVSGISSLVLLTFCPNPLSYKIIALLEGIGIGCITYYIEQKVPGAGIKALLITFASFIIMYSLFSLKLIKVTPKLKSFVYYGLLISIGILLSLIVLLLLNLVVLNSIILNVIFTFVFILGLLSLLISFNEVVEIVEAKVNKDQEWCLSISLLLSIILIYESVLQLIGINLD